MIKQNTEKQENKLRTLAIFQAVLVIFLSVAIGVVSKGGLDSSKNVKTSKKPAVFQAIPEGKEGFFKLSSAENLNSLTSGQEFDVSILIENTAALQLPDGITYAEVELSYGESDLELLEVVEGSIFANYSGLSQSGQGKVYLLGYSSQDDSQYPYNSNDLSDSEKVIATAKFKVIGSDGSTGVIKVEGSDDKNDNTNIITNVQDYRSYDIVNQAKAPNNGNLAYTVGAGGPTATSTPPLEEPTATPTDDPAVCGDSVCSSSEEYSPARWQDGTYCYEDCCENYTIESGDLDKNCKINAADWGIMRKNWTSAENLYYQPLENY